MTSQMDCNILKGPSVPHTHDDGTSSSKILTILGHQITQHHTRLDIYNHEKLKPYTVTYNSTMNKPLTILSNNIMIKFQAP